MGRVATREKERKKFFSPGRFDFARRLERGFVSGIKAVLLMFCAFER